MPKVEENLSFDELVQLGIFAWKYQISALSNQVTDRIRAHVASGEWSLEAAIVDSIYRAAPADSPLREVIKAALGQIPRSSIDGRDWERTFKDNPDLGWDSHKAGGKEWSAHEYLSGVCRFHNHDGIKRREGLCDGCPYSENDCYPVGQGMDQQEHQSDQVAEGTPAVGEQPTDAIVQEIHAPELPEPHEADAEQILAVTEGMDPQANRNLERKMPNEATEENNEAKLQGKEVEEANGTEPYHHVNGVKAGSLADEALSESMDGDAAADMAPETPRGHDGNAEPQQNGNGANGKSNGNVTVLAVTEAEGPRLTKKQMKKRAKRMSISYTNGGPTLTMLTREQKQ